MISEGELHEIEGRALVAAKSDDDDLREYGRVAAVRDVPRLTEVLKEHLDSDGQGDFATTIFKAVETAVKKAKGGKDLVGTPNFLSLNVSITERGGVVDVRLRF